MKFRPCIDVHNGQVKQIVGGTLSDKGNLAEENFVSAQDARFYAELYKNDGLRGGHIILLNPVSSEFYEKNVAQAVGALSAYPQGLQLGGGITDENAEFFLEKGASHVIVTSYVFKGGEINQKNLDKIHKTVGRDRLVLDLSCRKKDGEYYIVTDRWQIFTDMKLNESTLDELSSYCDEFLIHAVDVEGKASGIEQDLVKILAQHKKNKITYAGGVGSYTDLELLRKLGGDSIDVTIGSALDLFGGKLEYTKILEICR